MKKILMLTTVAMLGAAPFAVAQETTATENAFGLPEIQDDNLLIVLPLVTATADGVVEIRPVAGEDTTTALGSMAVTAGANEDVRISLMSAPLGDAVMAVLVIDGVDVAMQEIELSPQGGGSSDEDDGDSGDGSDDAGGDDDADDGATDGADDGATDDSNG